MRILPVILLVGLAGCQATPPTAPIQPAPDPLPPTPPARVPERDDTARRQAQLIEALINQNEALTQRLGTMRPATSVSMRPAAERRQEAPANMPPAKPFLVANAEGVIDLRAPAGKLDEPVNPFDVPAPSDGKGRELAITVSGIIAGAEACAVINERMVQVGDAVAVLTVETIARDAVFLALGERRMRLNVSETPVRVRLPD